MCVFMCICVCAGVSVCVCECEFGLQVSPFDLASCVSFWAHFRKSFDCFSRFNLPPPTIVRFFASLPSLFVPPSLLPSALMTVEHAMKYELIALLNCRAAIDSRCRAPLTGYKLYRPNVGAFFCSSCSFAFSSASLCFLCILHCPVFGVFLETANKLIKQRQLLLINAFEKHKILLNLPQSVPLSPPLPLLLPLPTSAPSPSFASSPALAFYLSYTAINSKRSLQTARLVAGEAGEAGGCCAWLASCVTLRCNGAY